MLENGTTCACKKNQHPPTGASVSDRLSSSICGINASPVGTTCAKIIQLVALKLLLLYSYELTMSEITNLNLAQVVPAGEALDL